MRLKKTKSLFSDGDPFIKIKEPFTVNDFDFKIFKPKTKITDDGDLKFSLGKSFGGSVAILLKPEVVDYIKEFGLDPSQMFQVNDFFSRGKERLSLYKSIYSDDVKFTGIRNKERKKRRYIKRFNSFKEDFDNKVDGIISGLIDDANESLEYRVKENNKDYISGHMDIFTTPKYEHAWEKEFKKDPEITKLEEESNKIKNEIKKLESKLKSVEKKESKSKSEIMKTKVKEFDLPKELKEDILKKLNSGESWKEKKSFGGLF